MAEGCAAGNLNDGLRGLAALCRSTFDSGLQNFLAGTSVLSYAYGGTGNTTAPANGKLLIGNGTGYTLANLTAGSNITITNSAGGIQIDATSTTSGSWTQIAQATPSSGSTVAFSSIPSSYSDLLIVLSQVGVSGTSTLRLAHSSNNGSLASADVDVSGTLSASSVDGAIFIPGYRKSGGMFTSNISTSSLSNPGSESGIHGGSWRSVSGMNWIQLTLSGSTFFTGSPGTITLYGM